MAVIVGLALSFWLGSRHGFKMASIEAETSALEHQGSAEQPNGLVRLPQVVPQERSLASRNSEWPEDPSDAIEAILGEDAGQDALGKLKKAAEYYAGLGFEPAKAFTLSLPPGIYGKQAFLHVIENYGGGVEGIGEFLDWIAGEKEPVDKAWVRDGLRTASSFRAQMDMEPMLNYLADSKALTSDERVHSLNMAIRVAQTDEQSIVLSFVDALGDQNLKAELAAGTGVLKARLECSASGPIGSIASNPDERLRQQMIKSLGLLMQNAAERESWLELMLEGSDFPERSQAIGDAVRGWMFEDVNSALKWVGTIDESHIRDTVIEPSWNRIASHDREAAAEWIGSISDLEVRSRLEKALKELPANP